MFSFPCNSSFVFPSNSRALFKLYFNGRDSTQINTTSILCFVKFRGKSIISSTISSTTFETTSTTDDYYNKSLTVSYLVNSCGLSEQKAISISNKLQLKTTSQPDSVLTLLRNYGFDDTQISIFVQRRPGVLLADPDKNLKPKIEFFNSIGICGTQLADILSTNPYVLNRSLENDIIPSIAFLKTLVETDADLFKFLKRNRRAQALERKLQKKLIPKIALLQAHGAPKSNILHFLTTQPRTLLQTTINRFREVVTQVKEMGFNPSKTLFIYAIHALLSMSQSVWEGKLDVYRRWGWSEEEIHMAFLRSPKIMTVSEKKIMRIMDVLVNKMGYHPSQIAHYPNVLQHSLEKRILPRYSVFQILITKGLVKKNHTLSALFGSTENYFLNRYVTKFQNEVPKLLSVYRQKVSTVELPGCHEEVAN